KSRVSTKKTASPTEKHPQYNSHNQQMQNLNRLLFCSCIYQLSGLTDFRGSVRSIFDPFS
ncbi:MAG: hypothetical protein KH091_12845, partial [Parabacteroides merdae]|nr:hypothetical protein [Parabacteroides merdae]